MPEMAHAGEDHRNAERIGSRNDFLIVYRSTWLNERSGSVLRRHFEQAGFRANMLDQTGA